MTVAEQPKSAITATSTELAASAATDEAASHPDKPDGTTTESAGLGESAEATEAAPGHSMWFDFDEFCQCFS